MLVKPSKYQQKYVRLSYPSDFINADLYYLYTSRVIIRSGPNVMPFIHMLPCEIYVDLNLPELKTKEPP